MFLILAFSCAQRVVNYPCWIDADGDGLGDPNGRTGSCLAEGFVSNDYDCDDSDENVLVCTDTGSVEDSQ